MACEEVVRESRGFGGAACSFERLDLQHTGVELEHPTAELAVVGLQERERTPSVPRCDGTTSVVDERRLPREGIVARRRTGCRFGWHSLGGMANA
jgi:hypothetical protein